MFNWKISKAQYLIVILLAMPILCLVLMASFERLSPYYLQYNATLSLPVGIYLMERCDEKQVKRGDTVAFQHQKPDWLPEGFWVDRSLKNIAGLEGDSVSVIETPPSVKVCISKNGQCKEFKRHGHLPVEQGMNGIIPENKMFVVGTHKDSLDSRYYGLVEKEVIEACAKFLF